MTTITFIGAGSTVFTKNIAGDILQRPALAGAEIRLMDINPQRLEESEIVVGKMAQTLGGTATVQTFRDQRAALDGADFVVVAFQIGGYDPCTVTDFEVPKKFGLRQTIADTLGIGGIMRGLRTVPHLWKICEDMARGLPAGDHAPVRQPDGDQHLGDRGEVPGHPPGRPLPLGAGHGRRARARPRHPGRGDPLPRRRHQPHGLLPQLRAPPARRQLPRPLSGAAPGLPRGPVPEAVATGTRAARTRCATRC